jgi:hypothetical protein
LVNTRDAYRWPAPASDPPARAAREEAWQRVVAVEAPAARIAWVATSELVPVEPWAAVVPAPGARELDAARAGGAPRPEGAGEPQATDIMTTPAVTVDTSASRRASLDRLMTG